MAMEMAMAMEMVLWGRSWYSEEDGPCDTANIFDDIVEIGNAKVWQSETVSMVMVMVLARKDMIQNTRDWQWPHQIQTHTNT